MNKAYEIVISLELDDDAFIPKEILDSVYDDPDMLESIVNELAGDDLFCERDEVLGVKGEVIGPIAR